MNKYGIALGLIGLLLGSAATAEKPITVAATPADVSLDRRIETLLDAYASSRLVAVQADYYKRLYEALLDKGFTRQETIQIIISQGNILAPADGDVSVSGAGSDGGQ